MTDFANIAEFAELTRRERLDAKRATWAGRSAFLDGKCCNDNPHAGWEKRENGLTSFQCLLWCRWMYGWLIEYDKALPPA